VAIVRVEDATLRDEVGVRELRHHLSRYLERVKAGNRGGGHRARRPYRLPGALASLVQAGRDDRDGTRGHR
jgi:hypothetical protein